MEQELIELINDTNKVESSEEQTRNKNIKRQIKEYNSFIRYLDIHIVELKSRVKRLEKMLNK